MSALVLPGTLLGGLLRRSAPVIATRRTHCGVQKGARGVLGELSRRAVWRVLWDTDGDGFRGASPAQQSCLGLDLTDPIGRVLAAWSVNRQNQMMLSEDDRQWLIDATIQIEIGRDPWPDVLIVRFRDLCLKLAGRAT
jgi:hypothetical protein